MCSSAKGRGFLKPNDAFWWYFRLYDRVMVAEISPTEYAVGRCMSERVPTFASEKFCLKRKHSIIFQIQSFATLPIDMFKRVEKRRRKKEEEEELGLDEDMKEVLGIQDTDSDESDSDSDSSDSQRSSEQEVNGYSEQGQEDKSEGEDNADGDEDGDSEDQSDNEEDKPPQLSVADALEDPIYLISLEPDVKGCITCPGKVLKHPKMINTHKSSGVRPVTLYILLYKLEPRTVGPQTSVYEIQGDCGQSKLQ